MPTFNISIDKTAHFSNTVNYQYRVVAEDSAEAVQKAMEVAEAEELEVGVVDYDHSEYKVVRLDMAGLRVVK